MRIGEAAAALGVSAHLLRHWEDVGVLVPQRTGAGHRHYTEDTVSRGRLVGLLQHAGLSLAQIRELLVGDRESQDALIAQKRADIAAARARLSLADTFLDHVGGCRHPVVSDCPECSELSRAVADHQRPCVVSKRTRFPIGSRVALVRIRRADQLLVRATKIRDNLP